MFKKAQHLGAVNYQQTSFHMHSHKYHVLCLWYISFQNTTLHVSTGVFTSDSWHCYDCEWPLLTVSYSYKPLLQSGAVCWFCMSCLVGVVLAVIYVFTTIPTSSWVLPNFLSNRYHGLFLWDEVSTTCPLFLCNTKIRNAQGCDVAQAHCHRGLVSVPRQ